MGAWLLDSHPTRETFVMTCPHCSERVPVKAVWKANGISGVVCPHCHASLCPTPITAVILAFVSFAAGEGALLFFRHYEGQLWLAIAGFAVAAVVVFSLLAPWILHLRPKDHGAPRLSHHGV